jgi:hypothetical protein
MFRCLVGLPLGPFVRHQVSNPTHYIRCDGQYASMYLSKRFYFLKFHSWNGQVWKDHLCNYASYYIWYHMLPYVDGEVDPSSIVASANKFKVHGMWIVTECNHHVPVWLMFWRIQIILHRHLKRCWQKIGLVHNPFSKHCYFFGITHDC